MKNEITKRILFAGLWWQHDLMRGIARHAARHGWHLNLQMLASGQLPAHWSGDGIITTLDGDPAILRDFFRKITCPVVSLSLNYPDIPIPRIGIDNDAVAKAVSEHFLERGFRHFAYYHRVNSYTCTLRLAAFKHLMRKHGCKVTNLSAEKNETVKREDWAERQTWLQKRLARLPKPLAVFAHDDGSGIEVIEACQHAAIKVPEKVAVLGMLDIDLFRESAQIPLSSVTVDFDAYTERVCDLLAAMMAGHPAPSKPILLPPSGVAVRTSSDVIAAHTQTGAEAIQFMQQHFAEPIQIMDVALAVGMSHTKFYQAFKADLGHAPNAVLTRIRINHAQRMLAETQLTLEVIAEDCGFGDRVNLHRNFQRHLHTTPAAYRRVQTATGILK